MFSLMIDTNLTLKCQDLIPNSGSWLQLPINWLTETPQVAVIGQVVGIIPPVWETWNEFPLLALVNPIPSHGGCFGNEPADGSLDSVFLLVSPLAKTT